MKTMQSYTSSIILYKQDQQTVIWIDKQHIMRKYYTKKNVSNIARLPSLLPGKSQASFSYMSLMPSCLIHNTLKLKNFLTGFNYGKKRRYVLLFLSFSHECVSLHFASTRFLVKYLHGNENSACSQSYFRTTGRIIITPRSFILCVWKYSFFL